MTTLTLAKLAEIEAAAEAMNLSMEHYNEQWFAVGAHELAQFSDNSALHIAICDPATVAALCRIARAAMAVIDQDDRGSYFRRNVSAAVAMDELRDVGLIEP